MSGIRLLEKFFEGALQFSHLGAVTSGSGHGSFEFVLPNAVFIGSDILPKWMNKPGRIRAWKEKFLCKMAHWNRLWTVQWAPLKGQKSP